MRGLLITFEGVEGSGKSTQAERLGQYLREQGFQVLLSREPGGTEIGERLRQILLDPACRGMDRFTELFLYLASRSQHVREKVLPAIRQGQIVVLDRFSDSSVAYQGYGRGIGAHLVTRLNRIASTGLRPDLTFVVDVPVTIGRERKDAAAFDRMESEDSRFHERVRDGYLRLARRAPGRIKLLDGRLPPVQLDAVVRSAVTILLERRGWIRR